jgi:hypothetical protein
MGIMPFRAAALRQCLDKGITLDLSFAALEYQRPQKAGPQRPTP